MKTPPSIAVLGGSFAGKTHFGGQLIGRLRQRQSSLRMLRAPTDRTIFDQVEQRLQEGRAAEHTSMDLYKEERLPIGDEHGNAFDLVWADYGGEQLDQAVRARLVSRHWQERLASASGWMLFVRLGPVTVYRTNAARLEASNKHKDAIPPEGWDENARMTELLQILLQAGQLSIGQPLARPKLLVALSCWDELESPSKPRDELRKKLPLVASFLEANWRAECLSVWGLSSLEKSLRNDVADDEYLERGPEQFGYVVREDGERSPDLVEPLVWLVHEK
jgi:hypothetical protein